MKKIINQPPPEETKVEPDFQGVDKAPGEETGKDEPVKKEDLTGKEQIDQDPGEPEKVPQQP